MPLPRHDGALVRRTTLMRRTMPHLLRTRAEAAVYYEQTLDVSRTLDFIARWNAAHPTLPVGVFQIVLFALSRVLASRPGVNRFVKGGRLYQRRGAFASFAVKKQFADYSPIRTAKLTLPPGEALDDFLVRYAACVDAERRNVVRPIEQELRLVHRLPSPLVGFLMRLARALDAINLLPAALTRDDPLFASVFVANLGSIGLDRAWHHLYEYGTVSIFCAVGAVSDVVLPRDGAAHVTKGMKLLYTYDERVNDGHYFAQALRQVQAYVERPEEMLTVLDVAELQEQDDDAERSAWQAEKTVTSERDMAAT